MTILGIETSCDETSAAVVGDGTLLSNVVKAQVFHATYGGVVPELASRAHLTTIMPVVDEALSSAGIEATSIDGVAAVYGPGLAGSLLVGLTFGKSLAFGLGVPFVGINHMEAHIVSNLLVEEPPEFPFLNLTVSGGHTQLVLVQDYFDMKVLGNTIDDAAGEAFDKVAKMLGLPYPGGPSVEARARTGDPKAVQFPRPKPSSSMYSFSFSGLKTAVLYYLKKNQFNPETSPQQFVDDTAASFQAAVVDTLVDRLFKAAEEISISRVCIAGGVSANKALRKAASAAASSTGRKLFMPPMEYCTDNGAMVALAGFHRLRAGKPSELTITAEPNLSLQGHA
jgi:N6-L-threonylcarbamoyladenine synthase